MGKGKGKGKGDFIAFCVAIAGSIIITVILFTSLNEEAVKIKNEYDSKKTACEVGLTLRSESCKMIFVPVDEKI